MGVTILNTEPNEATHTDRKVMTGASPLAANALGKLAAETLLAEFRRRLTMGATGTGGLTATMPGGPGIHGLQVPVFGHAGLLGAMSFGWTAIDSTIETRSPPSTRLSGLPARMRARPYRSCPKANERISPPTRRSATRPCWVRRRWPTRCRS